MAVFMPISITLMLSFPTISPELEMNVVLGLFKATNKPKIAHSAIKMVWNLSLYIPRNLENSPELLMKTEGKHPTQIGG